MSSMLILRMLGVYAKVWQQARHKECPQDVRARGDRGVSPG